MEFFTFILYFIFSLELPKVLAVVDGVSLSQNWPVPIDDLVSFLVTKEFNPTSVLIVDIFDKTLKDRKLIKIAKSNFIDWNTDYYTIKRDIAKSGTSSFTIKMSFRRKSNGTNLIFRWFRLGLSDSNSPEVKSEVNIIYSQKIELRAKRKIKVTVEVVGYNGQVVLNTEEKYFQIGKTVKITCSAYDGLPKARIYVNGVNSKRFRDIAVDENLNTWVGYLTLTLSDHNTNVSCSVGGTDNIESVQIKVNHVPTILSLEPEYNGYTKNGSKIRCISSDGYPSPIIKWDYVLIKNHSNPKSLYQINGDTLIINSNVQTGTELIFNCTAVYINPFENEVEIIRKDFKFEVGEIPAAAKDMLNSKIEIKIRSKRPMFKIEFEKLKFDRERKDKAFEELQRKCDEKTRKIDLLNEEIEKLRNGDKLKLDGTKKQTEIDKLNNKLQEMESKLEIKIKSKIEKEFDKLKLEGERNKKDLMGIIDETMKTFENKIDKIMKNVDNKLLEIQIIQKKMKNGEFVWRIDKINKIIKKSENGYGTTIYSDSFYTHKNGYKMRLLVEFDKNALYTYPYLSVYFCLMKGKFDDTLQWPFKYDVTFSLINQQTGLVHVSDTARYDDLPNHKNWNKPINERNEGMGINKLLELKELSANPNLMLNNQIVIKCFVNFSS